MRSDSNIPDQSVGKELTVEGAIYTSNAIEAEMVYARACKRLLNVNGWHTLTDRSVSVFQLTDSKGRELRSDAQEGNLIKIDVPAPGSLAGSGYDWVEVEKIARISTWDGASFSMRVRPVPSPIHPDEGVAHFFDDVATSTFEVRRKELFVKASVYGRNEVANVEAEKLLDKVRNSLVATGAKAGMAKLQWEALVNGLLSLEN
jgi:hypothetical protein